MTSKSSEAMVSNQMGDLDDDFQTKFAPAQHARDLPVLPLRIPMNLIGDPHRPTVFQPPHQPGMRQIALVRQTSGGIESNSH